MTTVPATVRGETPGLIEQTDRYVFHSTAMELKHDLQFPEWESLGIRLNEFQDALPFLIGDWLCYGDVRWGEDAAQAYQEQWQRKEKTLRKYQWVCSRVPRDVRIRLAQEDTDHILKFSHFEAVGKLKPPEQMSFLREAHTKGLSVRDLKEIVADYKTSQNGQEILVPATVSRKISLGKVFDPDDMKELILDTIEELRLRLLDGDTVYDHEITIRLAYEKGIPG